MTCEWCETAPAADFGCGLVCTDCPPCGCVQCDDARWDIAIDARELADRDARAEA